MKLILWAAVLGFGCWGVSEVLEIVQDGHTPTVYYLTAAYHLLAAIGIWGLYQRQTSGKSTFNLVAAAMASIGYIGVILFPIQVMNSGLTFPEFVDVHPIYKAIGFVWFLGMVLFSISVIRSGYFPKWAGVVMLIGTVIFTATPLMELPGLLANISNLIFAATVVYISVQALNST